MGGNAYCTLSVVAREVGLAGTVIKDTIEVTAALPLTEEPVVDEDRNSVV